MPNWNSKLLSYVKYVIIAIVVASFAFFGIYEAIISTQPFLATVDGVKITTQEYNDYANKRKTDILSGAMSSKQVYAQALEFVESVQFSKLILLSSLQLYLHLFEAKLTFLNAVLCFLASNRNYSVQSYQNCTQGSMTLVP